MTVTCVECRRTFDLTDEVQAEEWHFGHDCEEDNFAEQVEDAYQDSLLEGGD